MIIHLFSLCYQGIASTNVEMKLRIYNHARGYLFLLTKLKDAKINN